MKATNKEITEIDDVVSSKADGEKQAGAKKPKTIEQRISSIEKRMGSAENKLKAMSKSGFSETLNELKKDATELHGRLHRMIDRVTIISELSFSARHDATNPNRLNEINRALIWAIDQDDSFWQFLHEKTIGPCRDIILSKYAQSQLEYTPDSGGRGNVYTIVATEPEHDDESGDDEDDS